MNRFRPRRPSPAMTVALLALFVAMGGTGYAALKFPKNSVGAKQIKSNAVRSGEVKNRSLLKQDFKAGQLPRGPRGVRGLQGSPGAPATRLWVVMNADGTIARRSSPSITLDAAASDPNVGDYSVNFGRNISACVPAATITGNLPSSGEIALTTGSPKIFVDTRMSDGGDIASGRPFTLILFC
jgi:hypothetical protein